MSFGEDDKEMLCLDRDCKIPSNEQKLSLKLKALMFSLTDKPEKCFLWSPFAINRSSGREGGKQITFLTLSLEKNFNVKQTVLLYGMEIWRTEFDVWASVVTVYYHFVLFTIVCSSV